MTGTAPDPDRAVRLAVYRRFAGQGRPPSVAELAAQTGLAETAVRAALRHLHNAHAIVLTPAGDAVRIAHPFSAAPMGFVVSAEGRGPAGYAGDRMWWGGCAWDSFGIGAALGEPVVIRTRCPGCRRDLTVQAGPAQPPEPDLAVRVPCPARRWWDDVVGTCTNIRLFCDRSHAADWAVRAAPPTAGLAADRVISAVTMWRLAQPWYGDRLDPGWSPRTAAAAQRLLTQAGLTGDFWQLT
jgi:Alkylmercury lyase